MKRLLLLSLFCLVGISMNAQEISEEQWTLVTKKTADWCSLCGSWGWSFKDDLLEDQAGLPVVFWMAHHSGNLQTATSKAITDNLGAGGQPVFFINNDNMGVGSGNTSQKRDEFQVVIETLNSLQPFAGVGSTAVFDGEKITTTSKVKFLFDLEGGDYWLASYLVDDELIAPQASQGSNATHENVLRHSFHGSNYFGENIITGNVSANQEFTVDGEFVVANDPDLGDIDDGFSVVTVIWTRVNGTYTPLNLNRQPVTTLVNTKDILSEIDASAFFAGAGQVNLKISSDKNINDATIYVYDINGRSIAMKNAFDIRTGENQVMLESSDFTIGTYIVMIESSLGSKSIKVSVQ